MNLSSEQTENLIFNVNQALDILYESDSVLIEKRIHERAIAFRFALYFQELIRDTEFGDLDLDFEYNKREDDYKITPSKPYGSYPDLILHKRGIQDQNTLIIEFKCAWSSASRSGDFEKLQEYTRRDLENGYYYGLGLFIEFGATRKGSRLNRFIDGEIYE